MQIDVTLTATCRAHLLGLALASLRRNLFPHFDVVNVLVNVDPVYGDSTAETLAALTDLPGEVRVREAGVASHAAAIQWLWGGVERPALHFEDDFLLRLPVLPADVDLAPSVSALALTHDGLGEDRKHWLVDSRGDPGHGTSPRFLTRELANGYAARLDLSMCPEKQRRRGKSGAYNPDLHSFLSPHHVKVLAKSEGLMLHHMGKNWNVRNGVERRVEGPLIRRFWNGREL